MQRQTVAVPRERLLPAQRTCQYAGKRTAVVCPVKPLVTGAIDENYPTSLNISQLLGSGNEQFVVPSYAKAGTSWRARQVYELLDDVYLYRRG